MPENNKTKNATPSRPTNITLPPRSCLDSIFLSPSAFSPGPMTLISNLFSPDSDSRSFTQLLAGAMASPAAAASSSSLPIFLPVSSSSEPSSLPLDGPDKNWGFKPPPSLMNLVITPPSPLFSFPSGFLNSPGFFSPLQSPFGMTHQQALAHVTAQAALSQYRQVQTEHQPLPLVASADLSAPIPFASSAPTEQQAQTVVSEPESSKIESSEVSQSDGRPLPASLPTDKTGVDGYNWRKYGQKQVKASEYPRSYYKCTHINCPVKKKVERSPNGQITEIIYKGSHNHDVPWMNKRPKDGEQLDKTFNSQVKSDITSLEQAEIRGSNDAKSSPSVDENHTVALQKSAELPGPNVNSDIDNAELALDRGDDVEAVEPNFKKRNIETGIPEVASSHKTVTEPKIVVQTRSEIDLLDDGYKWRKYGQKVVKGNPYPRSYYRCTYAGCNVRKHVERASMDPKAVITTYDGKHNHEIPAGKNMQNTGSNLQSKLAKTVASKAGLRKSVGLGSQGQKHGLLQLKEEQVTA